MRRTKANRALTFVMAAALLIGSIHGVGAKEQSKAYDAPELTLTQGVTDYDLTEGITYDSEKYTLSVTDTGNFDVNVAGDYVISYALTEKESSVNVTESVENTESADSIESTETVPGTETIDTTEMVGDTDQTPEVGDTNTGDTNTGGTNTSDTNTGDTQEKQVITFTRIAHVVPASVDEAPGEETVEFEVPELYLEQGQEEYDLAAGLAYDESKYKLDVKDNGNFDIMLSGEYKVTFVLNPLEETPVSEGSIGDADASGADQAEDTFVISDGITTFTRRVVVTPGIALLAAGDTINNNYPWSSKVTDSSVTLSVPRDNLVGTPGVQWTKEATLGKEDIKEDSWEDVQGFTAGNKTVTLSGTSLVDGKWYRFKFGDNDYSEAVRLVYKSSKKAYKGNQKIPVYDQNQLSAGWIISNDEVMYAPVDPTTVTNSNFRLWFYYDRSWCSSTTSSNWYAYTASSANTMIYNTSPSPQTSPISFYFEGSSLFLNIKPVDKAYSLAGDICLGEENWKNPTKYYSMSDMRATVDRGTRQFNYVNKASYESDKPELATMVVKSYTDLCKWSAKGANNKNFFESQPDKTSTADAAISLSWLGQTDILVSISLTTLEKSSTAIADNVKFVPGDGTFTEQGKKQEYLFYDNEVLGTQQVYPPTDTSKVIEKIPDVTPNNNANFIGWKLSVTGAPDGDIDINNKIYSNDEVAKLKYKNAYGTMTFTAQYSVAQEAQIFTGGVTPAQKYDSVELALKAAVAGDTVKIIKAGQITQTTADGVDVVENVTLQPYNDETRSYKTKAPSKLAVDEDSMVTLKDGKLELSAQASIKVFNPADMQTYPVTTPDCTSWVTVDKNNNGDSPYFMGDANGDVQIGAVTYSYQNPDQTKLAMVYIPQGMKKNDKVTKAVVAADQTVTIEVDDTNSVVLNGGGDAANTVTVTRRAGDSKVDVKLPSGAQGAIFGHTVGAAPAGGVTVSQSSTENTGYPTRDYVMIATPTEVATIDGFGYTSQNANEKLYLGTFKVNMTFGANAGLDGAKPADPHYQEAYTITIRPATGCDLDKATFVLKMKDNDTADAKDLAYTEEAGGIIKVTVPKVTGDITIHAEAKKQASKLTINGLDGGGTVKVQDGEGHVHELKQANNSVNVNRNEELTLTFSPGDFTNPYYGDLTGEKGSSFSILTGLTDNTPGAAVTDLFTQEVKNSFNWTEKSYQVKYTPGKAENTLGATFTHSSIMHVHVTGGTAEVNTPGLVQNQADTESSRHVIVPDNTTVNITLKDTTAHTTVYKAAYWKKVSAAGGDIGTDVSSQLNNAGSKTYTYTTQAVSASYMLNVSFEQAQNVDVTLTDGHASLVQTGTTSWTNQGNNTYRTQVKNGETLTMKVQAKEGYGLKSITVNGFKINATEALKNPDHKVTYDEATRTYTHTTKPIDQSWTVVMDFEEKYSVSFEDQKGGPLGTITAVNGTTIPEDKFTEMQAKTDKLKEGNETFLAWVDKADGNTVYNKNTPITKNNLVLKPVYRKDGGNGGHIENGRDGSILAADDFTIHVNDLKNLTADTVKGEKYANVTAFDKDGAKATAQVTVNAGELAALKTKSAGTHINALTFTYNTLSVKVTVEITDDKPVITGKTASALAFRGRAKEIYEYQELDAHGSLTGNSKTIQTDAEGKATITGLKKATQYQISHKKYGSVIGKTALVDAKDIARQFEDEGANDTSGSGFGKDETAGNSNVNVVVGDDGSYKVIVKKNIAHTIEIPDTWGEVKLDLNGKTITGNQADESNAAKPGLDFVKDGSTNEHPGTKLEITNGTIKGGNGSGAHPDGAAGIGVGKGGKSPADAELIIGNKANIIGGNGAHGSEGKDGGNGGAGIAGNSKITPTVNGGNVTGGNGGNGGDSATGKPGNGGNGGAGISAGTKNITINSGTVKGGNAGKGGNATGDNKNPGGNGGNGGNGTETEKPGKTDNNGGTISGGNGGDGGDSDKGNGGTGGNGGNSGETGGTGGNNSGGNGGNGGGSGSGNVGTGGNGGGSNSGTGGTGGNDGKSYVEVLFEDRNGNSLNAGKPVKIVQNEKINQATFNKMQQEADQSKKENEVFFAWVDKNDDTKAYTAETEVTSGVTLVPVYRTAGNIKEDANKNTIAADDFSIRKDDVASLTADKVKTRANVRAYDKTGKDITDTVIVDQNKLDALKKQAAGTYTDALSFQIPNSITASVTVEITDDNPVITGRTAHTLTFTGRAKTQYSVQKKNPAGRAAQTFTTDADGKATATGLEKATEYQISHIYFGSADGRTALVDATEIADQFRDENDTTSNNSKTDKSEKAWNNNVEVTVDDDGKYKVTVKKDIDHAVQIPDTWGDIRLDLGGHTITGNAADENNQAKPGLEFVKDGSTNVHPGTKLEIVNGTIKGGDGSSKHPAGAPGIEAAGNTADAGLIIGNDAKVIGGNGANGTEGKDGGNGGAGINGNGKITPTVSGTVTGGNGGKGGDSATGIPGNGGNGGTGISAGGKTITINPGGTVKGGDAGSGGNATGDNTNPGGNGGNGGTGTETTQPGKTDNNGGTTSGGNGGDGGTSNNGNGGNGGDGGSGSTGENNNNGGTSSGGNGGNGGDSNNGTGGNGGNGGDSNNGTGGNGGNGGESNSGNGGNGGDGGNGKNPGTGGNGGGSNSGNNGSSGSDGSKPDNNGGNGGSNGGNNNGNGGSNGGDNGNNNGGSGSGGNSNGDTNGTNTGVTDGKTNATDIAAADANNASGGNKNNKHNKNNRNNNESDQADGEDVTEGTETDADSTDADTGSDDTTDVADSTETGTGADGSGNADDSIPADSSDADGHISFADCGSHWYPIILILVIAGYTVLRIRKIREELDGE